MGDISISEDIPFIHQPYLSPDWYTEEEWVKNFNVKYSVYNLSKMHKLFTDTIAQKFIFFFTTDLKRDNKKYGNNLMMVVGEVKEMGGNHLGDYVELNNLYRFGFYDVNSWEEIQQVLKDDTTIKIMTTYKVPIIWLGNLLDYPHLLDKVKEQLTPPTS